MDNKDFAEKMINEYSKKEMSSVDELKKLDCKVKTPAYVFAYTYGIIGALILGVGMCLAMNVIGGTTGFMIFGIIVGIIGIAIVSTTYPIFSKILNHRKSKYAEEIIEKSNKILNK